MAQANGGTPLFIGSQKGYLEVVRCLADAGADINRPRGRASLGPGATGCAAGVFADSPAQQ